MVATLDHDLHRRRRGHASGFLFKGSILSSENLISDKIDDLARRLRSAYHEGSVLSLQVVFAALAGDVITHCVYGASMEYLDDQSFSENAIEVVSQGTDKLKLQR